MDWLTTSPELLVIHYEDFLTDPTSELESVLEFLRYPVDPKRMECIRDNQFNKWKRFKKESDGFKSDPFEDLHRIFDSAIRQVQDELKYRGYKTIPIEKYQHVKDA